jgi:hypothetical protein
MRVLKQLSPIGMPQQYELTLQVEKLAKLVRRSITPLKYRPG